MVERVKKYPCFGIMMNELTDNEHNDNPDASFLRIMDVMHGSLTTFLEESI